MWTESCLHSSLAALSKLIAAIGDLTGQRCSGQPDHVKRLKTTKLCVCGHTLASFSAVGVSAAGRDCSMQTSSDRLGTRLAEALQESTSGIPVPDPTHIPKKALASSQNASLSHTPGQFQRCKTVPASARLTG